MKTLITGATGFVGKATCEVLRNRGFDIRIAVRKRGDRSSDNRDVVEIGDIGPETDWQQALAGINTVIHLAARVHIANDTAAEPIEAFRRVNVLGTERLALMAAKAGVKRFIFISSVKVNGEGALRAYTEKDIPKPKDAYGASKLEAEDVLAQIAVNTGLEVVILRLPLVYGPGVKANFKSLIKIVSAGLPLPFKGINNRRSFLYLGNLTDAIIMCATHPLAAGQTFMLSDGRDLSTPDLINMIACAMKKKAVLFYLPQGILKAFCKTVGMGEELEKLTGTLVVDSSKIRNLLGWKPPFTMEEGIGEIVKGI